MRPSEKMGLLSGPAAIPIANSAGSADSADSAEDVHTTPKKLHNQIVYQSSDTGYWPLVISFLMIGTPLTALTGAEIFGSTFALGGVSITVVGGLIGFAAISALALMTWGIGAHRDGREEKKTNFWNFIKTSGTILGLSLFLSAGISAFATWKAGLSLAALKTTALSAIAATTPLSTFLVGTVALTLFISALTGIYQNVIKPRRKAAAQYKDKALQLKAQAAKQAAVLMDAASRDDANDQVHAPVASQPAEPSQARPRSTERPPVVEPATEEREAQQEALQLKAPAAVLMAAASPVVLEAEIPETGAELAPVLVRIAAEFRAIAAELNTTVTTTTVQKIGSQTTASVQRPGERPVSVNPSSTVTTVTPLGGQSTTTVHTR